MIKIQKKHIDKEQGKTNDEALRSVNYRATKNKNNINTVNGDSLGVIDSHGVVDSKVSKVLQSKEKRHPVIIKIL